MGRDEEKERIATPPPLLPFNSYSRPVPQWMVEEAACTLTPTTPDRCQGLTSSPLTANTHSSMMDSADNQLTTDMLSDDQTPPSTPKSYIHGLMELQTREAEARNHLEEQVSTRKKFLHSLITSTTSLDALSILLPDTLWNHDYLRLALIFAVCRGSVDVVRYIVNSAFRGYHIFTVANSYMPHKLFTEYGLRHAGTTTSFLQLAVRQLVCDAEEGVFKANPALRRDREEIFKMLITARGMCYSEGDMEALEEGARLLGGVLTHWKDEVKNISCLRKACNRSARRCLTWTPNTTNMFPDIFRKRAQSVCRVGVQRRLPAGIVEGIVAYMPYADNGGKVDPNDPVRKFVADVIDGKIVHFDGSVEVMKKYSQHCRGSPPVPGLRVVATITTMRGPQCMTGHITGVHDELLYWRPLNASSSEPLTGVFFLNPLANQADLDIKGDCWLCGMCMLLNSKSMEKCRRCYNTHQGALTLEGQRKKQNVNGTSVKQAQKVKQAQAMYQRQAMWGQPFYDRYIQPFTAINLTAVPPRHEVFETADMRLAPFRVHSGQMVCANGANGMIIGLGRDEALYWAIEGAPGASRLALTPEALQSMLHH
eukprot:TRINITY_DN8081_c2_g1_i1.p1 TRINITY_DN8081_c2_g1~~TRINITY_DN8081_c2_g1_i1.p1  ORF type:complete len:652 (+),score=208.56 TRINITY_DN8081_c2_g1_i1:172-1956(+)